MKKIMAVLTVLSLATIANAELGLSVNGQADSPNASIWMTPGQTVNLGVWSDGATVARYDVVMSINGPGSLDITNGFNYQDGLSYAGGGIGWVGDNPASGLMWMDLAKPPIIVDDWPVVPPIDTGTVVDNLILHFSGPGDVTLSLYDADHYIDVPFDTLVVHQVPEPMTLGLLGLGGLFLRRRK